MTQEREAFSDLPPLPEPRTLSRGDEDGPIQLGYTAAQMRAYARASLAQPASVPAGWKLVPVEPTDDMIHAGYMKPWGDQAARSDAESCWSAMLAAAPQAPQPAQEVQAPAPAQRLPLAVSSAPGHIWLDLGFDPAEEDAHFSNLHTLTWSEDNASGYGIKYIRADLAAQAPAVGAELSALDALAELCDEATGGWDLPPSAVARIGALARKARARQDPGAYDRGVITGLRQAAAICVDREDMAADRIKTEIEACIAAHPPVQHTVAPSAQAEQGGK